MTFPSNINNKAGGQLLTIEELAERLNCSKSTIYGRVKEQRMPEPLRFGNGLRWRPEQINEWIAAGMPERINDDPTIMEDC